MLRTATFVKGLALAAFLSQPVIMPAQNTAPFGGTAPAGHVTRPGHLGREIGDLDSYTHFYYDLLRTGMRGQRNDVHNFFATPGLTAFANSPATAQYRSAIFIYPGTATEP